VCQRVQFPICCFWNRSGSRKGTERVQASLIVTDYSSSRHMVDTGLLSKIVVVKLMPRRKTKSEVWCGKSRGLDAGVRDGGPTSRGPASADISQLTNSLARPPLIMNSFRVARAALRVRPTAFAAPLARRGYADVASDKIQLSLSLPHQVRSLRSAPSIHLARLNTRQKETGK
jgi:hypothetical protein